MKNRLQRRVDKENSFNAQYLPRSRTPIGANINSKAPLTPSNTELRKKLDQNYQKLLSSDQPRETYDNGDYQSSKNRGKRSNAKNRGFDQKVTNISTINDKINSLLSMVKKDKQNQRHEKLSQAQREKTVNRSREIDSPNVEILQSRKQQPSVSPFIKDKYEERDFVRHEQRYSVPEIPEYQLNRYEDNSKKSIDHIVSAKQGVKEEGKDLNLKHLRRKYLPDEEVPYQKHKRQTSAKWERPIEQQDSRFDYSKNYSRNIDNANKNTQKTSHPSVSQANKSNGIDKMLEERKRKREQQRQQEKIKFQQSIRSSTFKEAESFKQQYVPQKTHNLAQPTPPQQNHRNQKINTATRLIDEQIEKIKSKIQQSENNNQKNQKKLSSHKKGVSNDGQNKQHTTQLALKISSQVELDTKLRQARFAFEKASGEQKWGKLQQQIKAQGIQISLDLIKQLIRISPEERNPFTGQNKGLQSWTDLPALFAKAQNNWDHEVCGNISINDLAGEGFNPSELDLGQKGSLGLEDLVCFINLYTGHFYRNRDLALVFRRLQLGSGQTGNSLSYQGFEGALTV